MAPSTPRGLQLTHVVVLRTGMRMQRKRRAGERQPMPYSDSDASAGPSAADSPGSASESEQEHGSKAPLSPDEIVARQLAVHPEVHAMALLL